MVGVAAPVGAGCPTGPWSTGSVVVVVVGVVVDVVVMAGARVCLRSNEGSVTRRNA